MWNKTRVFILVVLMILTCTVHCKLSLGDECRMKNGKKGLITKDWVCVVCGPNQYFNMDNFGCEKCDGFFTNCNENTRSHCEDDKELCKENSEYEKTLTSSTEIDKTRNTTPEPNLGQTEAVEDLNTIGGRTESSTEDDKQTKNQRTTIEINIADTKSETTTQSANIRMVKTTPHVTTQQTTPMKTTLPKFTKDIIIIIVCIIIVTAIAAVYLYGLQVPPY